MRLLATEHQHHIPKQMEAQLKLEKHVTRESMHNIIHATITVLQLVAGLTAL